MAEVVQSELSSGTILSGGKYVIEGKIGAGGFGITYLARHTVLDRKYAIKEFFMSGYNVRNNETNRVSIQGLEHKDFDRIRQTFINEARTLAHLNNKSIVKVIDIFDENGTSYMVMPFVEGTTLKSIVEKEGPMECEIAINYMVQICEALTYVHSKDILHRDVTPDNVIVTREQKIVLIDFGSARKFVDNKTQRQTTIVKPGYAPLEQHSARSRKGAYTDIYSVGAVFYYLLTGERPMDATERVFAKMKEPVELNPNIPPQINTVIMKAMEMDGEMRYQSAKELIDDILSDEPINTENFLDEVVEVKEIVSHFEEDVMEETTSETQQKIMSIALGFQQDVEYVKDRDNSNIAKAKDNKESQTIREEGRMSTLPIVVAIILALVAVFAIYAVIVYRPFSTSKQDSLILVDTLIKLTSGEKYAYEGEKDTMGVPNGYGKATFEDRVYIGNFENGNMNGYGELIFTSGIKEGRIYKAMFVDNCINDTCTVISGSNVYKGTLKDNMEYDCGVQINLNAKKKYEIKDGEIKKIIDMK